VPPLRSKIAILAAILDFVYRKQKLTSTVLSGAYAMLRVALVSKTKMWLGKYLITDLELQQLGCPCSPGRPFKEQANVFL
jgi:uncharacterized membrane protein YfbV (UPF0208 family)